MDNNDKKNQIIDLATKEEFIPVEVPDETTLKEYTKIPINEISGLGAALAELTPTARRAESTITVNANGIYRCTFPKGISGELAKAKDGSGDLGAIVKKGDGLQGQARWNKINAITGKQSFTVPISPLNMFMAATMVEMNHKLNRIQKTANDILEYQKEEIRAKGKGDLETLVNIYNESKLHIKDKQWQQSELQQVLSIKNEAVKLMDLHYDRINSILGKTNGIHNSQMTKKTVDLVQDEFQQYRLSLFIYSFARFIETLFFGNFDHENLKAIKKDINSKDIKYRNLYTDTYNNVRKQANTSVESKFLKKVSNVNKVTGKAINRIPLVNKGSLDVIFVKAGRSIAHFDKDLNEKSLSELKENIHSGASQFVEGINRIDNLYNNSLVLLMDRDNIYLKVATDLNKDVTEIG